MVSTRPSHQTAGGSTNVGEVEHVLVTGACGLVGTAVVDRMLADGWRVTATDLSTPANTTAMAKRRPDPTSRSVGPT